MPVKDMQSIAEFLQELKFRKKLLGGVDEQDVWRKLEALQKEYQTVYDAQEAYWQAQLDERDRAVAILMKQCKEGTKP